MSHRGPKLRRIADPFVIAPPSGARVRTRLNVAASDAEVLQALGAHLGSLASSDLARRVTEGKLDAAAKAASRRVRKQALTAKSSSRWAGAITRTTEDAYGLATRNLQAERVSLVARVKKISGRVRVPIGETKAKTTGYAAPVERWQKQRRAQHLASRLATVQAKLDAGAPSICRGGKRLAKTRHNLEAAGQSAGEWKQKWEASRWFLIADGEAGKRWGNETIRWNPDEQTLQIKLPPPLAHLANRPFGRYQLTCKVEWPYRGDDVAAQASTGAVRYDISRRGVGAKARWYLDASWSVKLQPAATLEQLRRGAVVAVDLNVGHLAVAVLAPSGNPIGVPTTIPLVLSGLAATTRDGRIRGAISQILAIAADHQAGSVVIENLDFVEQRVEGREHSGNRPSRGKRGKTFRRHISGLPTARLRDRLTQMAHNSRIAVIAVDPAYTSKWGAPHWLAPLKAQHPHHALTGHHAAAVAIGRRGLSQRLRRCGMSTRITPEDVKRATAIASNGGSVPAVLVAGLAKSRVPREVRQRNGTRQPSDGRMRRPRGDGRKTDMAFFVEASQETQDRSGSPAGRDSLTLSV